MSEVTIQDFLNDEYSQSALYASFRSIASYVDGLKPASRKVVHTVKKKNITENTKVSRLAATVSEQTEYLHGETSLQSVISNLAQDFTGSNNENLLYPAGSFGTRFVPSPSAPRYIFTKKSEHFNSYFKKEDDDILVQQEFEGTAIEPKFFVPVLPLLLINGSEGIGTGFAQKILPRKKEIVIEYIQEYLKTGSSKKQLKPHYNGFTGKVVRGLDNGSWEIAGTINMRNRNTIEVTELPIGYTLASYLKVLDTLEEKKVIKGYVDLSENDKFLFNIDVTRDFTLQEENKILDDLKLIKRVTENLTTIDENNCIREFDSVQEILNAYIDIRLEYYKKRKQNLLSKYRSESDVLESKAAFIKAVIDGNIIVNNNRRDVIVQQIDNHSFNFTKVDGDYDYLLNMQIYSLTKERYDDLKKKVLEKKQQIKELKSMSEQDLWSQDLK